jgi:hypothetical protein
MQSPEMPPTDAQGGPVPPARYETRDVDPKVIAGLVGAIVLIVAFSLVGLRLFMTSHAPAVVGRPERLNVDQTPPEPRLQSAPLHDYRIYVTQQEQRLNSYGWVDRKAGTVHIPVPRAMELAVEKGLPFPTAPQDSPSETQP